MLRNGIKKSLKLSIIFVFLCVSMLFALAFTEFAYAEEETSNDMEKEEERSEEEDAEGIKEEEDTEKQEKDLEEEKEEPSEGDDVYNVPLDEGDKEKDNEGSKEVNQEQFKGEAMTHEMAPALKGIPEPKLTLYQSGGKWYIRDESTGLNLKGQWATIEDKKYYASDNEYLWQSRTINMAGKNYYVGDDCSVQYGVVYAKNNGNYYYADQSNGGAFVKGQWIDHNGKKYYASDSEPLH